MVVTHLFQVLAFVAMEPPTALEPRAISEEKNKVFRSMLPIDPRQRRPRPVQRLPQEDGVARDSDTETFIALQVRYRQLAMGGRTVLLPDRQADGRGPADHLDRLQGGAEEHVPGRIRASARHGPDHLTFDLADESKVSLSFYGKRPGPGMKLDKLSMQFSTQETDRAGDILEAYERLIMDAMRDDHTLFTTAEGIESLWDRSEALLHDPPPVKPYAPGSWGPNAIHQMIAPHAWRLPFERAWRAKRLAAC